MDIYADAILDHYRTPRNKVTLTEPTISHTEKNVSCGDALTVELQIDGDKILAIGWSGEGCAISQAAMSMLAEELAGKTLDQLKRELAQPEVLKLLGVPIGPRRMKCAMLAAHALQNALRATANQPPQSWVETLGNSEKTG